MKKNGVMQIMLLIQINKEQRDFLKELFQKYLTEEGVVEALAMEDAGYIEVYKMI